MQRMLARSRCNDAHDQPPSLGGRTDVGDDGDDGNDGTDDAWRVMTCASEISTTSRPAGLSVRVDVKMPRDDAWERSTRLDVLQSVNHLCTAVWALYTLLNIAGAHEAVWSSSRAVVHPRRPGLAHRFIMVTIPSDCLQRCPALSDYFTPRRHIGD